jgi:hypothetical protein
MMDRARLHLIFIPAELTNNMMCRDRPSYWMPLSCLTLAVLQITYGIQLDERFEFILAYVCISNIK